MKPASPIARLISRLNEMLRSVERAGARSARRRDLCRIDTLFAAERLEDRTLLTAPEFAEVGTYLGLSTPLWSSSGDFNEDGFEDLVVSAYASSTLNVYFNLGNGSFNSSPLVLPTAAGHTNLHVADINGDSHLDIIAGHTASGGVSVRLGNGAGNFGAHTFFPTGAWVHAIDVADINADGKQDIVAVNYNAHTISVLAGNGNGGFTEVNEFAGTTGMSSVRIADFNQDGKLDLVTSDSVVNLISVRFGNGDATFSAATNYATSAYPYKLQVFDADCDGILDIFCAEYVGDRVSYLRGLPGGTFAAPVGLPGSGTMDGADELRVGDVNNDGFEDLVVNELNAGRTRMLLGHGDGTFELSPTILNSGPYPRGGVLADLNNDGNLDWAAVSETSGSVNVFLQNNTAPISNPGGPYSVQVGTTLTLDGSTSTDPENNIASYEWDFNYDGTTFNVDATGVAPVFDAAALTNAETRTIALRVTDGGGLSHIATTTLTIRGLVAQWSFNEGTGSVAGDSVDGLNGVINGNANWVQGPYGSALYLDGNDTVDIPHSDVLNVTTELTLEAWVRFDSVDNNYEAIVTKTSNSSGNNWESYAFMRNRTGDLSESWMGRLSFNLETTAGRYAVRSTFVPVANQWYYLVGTYDGTVQKLYVNGQLDSQILHGGTVISSTQPLWIGHHPY
ncbi:MAG: VCBS repeat-containing protein, partial [Planctomycetaceae bacterium]|nr:VCBS repeat-containing protein [Planctomycetaceae bacterium]